MSKVARRANYQGSFLGENGNYMGFQDQGAKFKKIDLNLDKNFTKIKKPRPRLSSLKIRTNPDHVI
jgi:hypothetical protein